MRTLAEPAVTETLQRRSRFIAALQRCDTEHAARDFITARRSTHPKATHHCTAYILGPHGDITRTNDDGEPSGTAAAPMLDVLQGHQLTDTTAVVTRYFGGIKLGAGGLARAYAHAVAAALADTPTFTLTPAHRLTITCGYANASLEAELRAHHIHINHTEYAAELHFDITVADTAYTWLTDWLATHTGGQATITDQGPTTLETG